jgi:fibronectin-binding autotransporter adhesin
MKYANTSATAGNYFNIGWSNGGSIGAGLVSFKETTGGTEFAPLAGSGGVAVVGPSAGTVATFAKAVSIATPGTVGFYNAGTNNVRGTVGNVVFQNDLSGVGTVQAGTVTFNGGSLSPGLSAGTLSINGNLVLSSTTAMNFELNTPGVVGSGVNDLVAVNGNLNLAGQLNVFGSAEAGTYTLFTYTGTLTTGTLTAPAFATFDFSQSGLVLLSITAVPEPGSWMLVMGLAPMALAARRRKRA